MATPTEKGYRWPAEWERQQAIWMTWPHDPTKWQGEFDSIPPVFAELAATLSAAVQVRVLVRDAGVAEEARALITERLPKANGSMERVGFEQMPTNDVWLRDCGPIFLLPHPEHRATLPAASVGWRFNGWGNNFTPWDDDDRIPARLSQVLGIECFAPHIILEGGSVEGNGAGTLLTTEECLLNPNRNKGLGKPQLEKYFQDYLGARRVVWLNKGLNGDDTGGHIDMVARFIAENTVVISLTEDRADPNFHRLWDNHDRLQRASTATNSAMRIVELPLPEPVYFKKQRLTASYVNFVYANNLLVVPTYGVPADRMALAILQREHPQHRVVGIRAEAILRGGGAFHCATQNQPAS